MRTTSLLLAAAAFVGGQASAASCEGLPKLSLPDTLAQPVAAGEFTLPPSSASSPPPWLASLYKGLPAFCRVAATIAPSKDSEISIEVWMPAR